MHPHCKRPTKYFQIPLTQIRQGAAAYDALCTIRDVAIVRNAYHLGGGNKRANRRSEGGSVKSKDWFSFLAQNAARRVGSSYAFIACCVITGVWLLTGPVFHWSDTWQLIINTLTNIVSLLMLFLIQNTQNREMTAAQLKLDELIRSLQGAHNVFLNLEDLGEEDLDRIRQRYSELAVRARRRAQQGDKDTGTPTVEIQLPDGFADRRASTRP